jgi:glycyl-tRNA synthetase
MIEEELDEVIASLAMKSPEKGNELSKTFRLNLMFSTQIGQSGSIKGYLRPETAQGHFVNFKKLYDYNGGKLPFASAMIGLGFRNEISPRAVIHLDRAY